MEKQIEYYVAHLKHTVQRSFVLSVLLVAVYFGYNFLVTKDSSMGFASVAIIFLLPANLTVQGLILLHSTKAAKKLPGFDKALAEYTSDPEARAKMQAGLKVDRKPHTLLLTSSQRVRAILIGLIVGALAVWLLVR